MYGKIGKRLLDILVAVIVFVVLSPLFATVAVLIRLFDPGPVIFRQRRVGRFGSTFTFYKFRSMPVGTGDLPSAEIGEISVTRIGRFIRRTNLDELPQLANIIKGDMSLVGPRPPLPTQVDLVALRRANGAILCRPGLTGLAQVNAYDGMTNEEKAAFDGEYVRRLSFVTDVHIVFQTFGYLLHPPPKY